jgi:hypothetical protein
MFSQSSRATRVSLKNKRKVKEQRIQRRCYNLRSNMEDSKMKGSRPRSSSKGRRCSTHNLTAENLDQNLQSLGKMKKSEVNFLDTASDEDWESTFYCS